MSARSDRAKAAVALRESHEQFRLLVDNITDAFWIRSADMRELHYLSPAFERIWGRSVASLHANPHEWTDFIQPDDRTRVVAAFARLTEGDTPTLDIEYRIVRPGGEIRWVHVRGFQVRDAAGILTRHTGIVTDITEKKQLEAQFLRTQRMEGIGTLASGIAHDLNNVLAPILMSVELLKDLVTEEADLAMLATLQASAQRGADLVKQVLAFARGVDGERVTVNLIDLMRELLTGMLDTFPKSIDVQFAPAHDLWAVTGDTSQMQQVLLNLCINARDAMPAGGPITIGLDNVVLDEAGAREQPDSRPGAYVRLSVTDTGTGITPETRLRIFEPFFTTKDVGKGTGLGLSTTLAIVKSHGGFIDVTSEAGAGSTFCVYLPANVMESSADHAGVAHPVLPRGRGELILVVDDEDGIRKLAQRMLERFGYRVLLACDGEEAVALYALRQQEIAVVLTDMTMPNMDGPALIAALKTMSPGVRIIGSSGLTSRARVNAAVAGGVPHFLPKPYTADALLEMLQSVLHTPRVG